MQNKYEFVVDEQGRTVEFAGKVFKYYQTVKTASDSLSVMDARTYGKPKEIYKEFTEKFGITPSNFKKCFNAAMRRIWVAPVEKHVMRYAFGCNGKIVNWKVSEIWNNKHLIEQCEKDGIENVVPFVVKTGLSPKELKEALGKSVWKKITRQSMTRNKYLSMHGIKNRDISTAVDFPSHILKRGGMVAIPWDETGKWLLDQGLYSSYKKERDCHYQLNKFVNIYKDTKRMSEQLGKGFSAKWSADKMKSKHEEYTKLVLLKKYSPEPFNHLKGFEVSGVANGKYIAELCASPLAIREEGESMHHCVGGYSDYVAQNKYLVYSVKKEGKRSSTLGIWIEEGKYRFSQHYGACNARLTDQEEIELAHVVIDKLNGVSLK